MATPTTTIDALPAAASVTGAQLLIVQEVGVTKHASVDALATYVGGHITIPMTAAQISALANPDIAGVDVQAQLTDLIAKVAALTGAVFDTVWTGPSEPPDTSIELWYDTDEPVAPIDSVHVGIDAPTDPALELWWDSDEPSTPVTGGPGIGVLKVRTATGPDVWTTIAGGVTTFASNAEVVAGVETSKAVSPATLKAGRSYVDVHSYGAVGDGATDDTAALQAAINACNAAGGGIVSLPKGIYVTSAPLDMLGKSGVELRGVSKLATAIRQSDLTVPVIKVQGSYIVIADMQLRYATQSTTAGANALELQGIVSFSDFRDLYLWNCNIGISYGGAISPTGEFSNSWTNIHVGPFNASGIKLQPVATQSTGSHWSNIYISNYTGSTAGVCTDYPLYLQAQSATFNQLNIEWCNVVTTNKDLCIFQQCSGVVINKMHMEGNVLPTARAFLTTFSSGGCTVQINGLDLYGNTAASGNVGIVRPGAANNVMLSNVFIGANAALAASFYAILDSSAATNATVIVDNLQDLTNVLDGFSLNYVGTAHSRGYKGATVGFYGATPVAKAANPGTAAGSDAAVINAVVTALRNLGLVT